MKSESIRAVIKQHAIIYKCDGVLQLICRLPRRSRGTLTRVLSEQSPIRVVKLNHWDLSLIDAGNEGAEFTWITHGIKLLHNLATTALRDIRNEQLVYCTLVYLCAIKPLRYLSFTSNLHLAIILISFSNLCQSFCINMNCFKDVFKGWFSRNAEVSHRASFREQRPGDELQQRHQPDQPVLLQSQHTQHLPQLIALNATTLQHKQTLEICLHLLWKAWHQPKLKWHKSKTHLKLVVWLVTPCSPRSPPAAPLPTPWSSCVPPHWHPCL